MYNSPKKLLKRRTFLKGVTATGTALSLTPLSMAAGNNDTKPAAALRTPEFKLSELQTFRSSCAMECLHCNLTAYVHEGKVVKVRASENFNVKGCLRGISRTKWVNHKERLTTPLLRVGEKGKGEFKPISWDEALNLIETKLKETIAQYGNEGLLLSTASGNMDAIKNGMAGAFFNHLGGCTRHSGSLCCSAVTAAMNPMVGIRYADTRDTIADSRYLICWGNNPAVTMHAYFKDYTAAKRNGAKLIVIDPRYSETAAKADEWIPIIPGTDTALALGMIHTILKEKLYDDAFLRAHTGAVYLVGKDKQQLRESKDDPNSYLVYDTVSKKTVRHDAQSIRPALTQEELPKDADYTTVFELIRQEAAPWSAEKVQEETDVPQDVTLRLARDYAKTQPAMIIQNMSGAQRTEYGTYVAASQFYLALLTGNMGKAGAGICDAGGVTQFTKMNPPVPNPPNLKPIATIPVSKYGEWIMNDRPHPIGFWWIMTMGVATQIPNSNKVEEALKKVPFVVVADNLMASSALFADLVLPVTTIFEDTSLMAGVRSHYLQLMEKAVEPVGEAKPDYWIFARLAERFGFGDAFNKPIEHYIETALKDTGVTLEQLRKGPVKPVNTPWIPFKDGIFRTPTKKAHFFVEAWQKKSFSPIATYMRVKESPKGDPGLAALYPLMAVQRKLQRSIHTSHGTNEWILEIQRTEAHVLIHPEDAQKRNIQNEQWVKVYNARGEHRAKAIVTTHMKKGVVTLDNGWWRQQGGSSSVLTNDYAEELGHGQACNSTLVEIKVEA